MRLVLHLTRRELPDNRMQLRRQQRLSRSSLCRRSRPFPPSKSIGHACGRILRTIRTFAVPVQSAAATRTTSCAVGASDASSPGSSWRLVCHDGGRCDRRRRAVRQGPVGLL